MTFDSNYKETASEVQLFAFKACLYESDFIGQDLLRNCLESLFSKLVQNDFKNRDFPKSAFPCLIGISTMSDFSILLICFHAQQQKGAQKISPLYIV